jgi:hypothetical protein
MPISINGSGTITGINAGGLPDDCITTAEIAANAVTYAKIGTTEQGQLCKAWVNFNGTGTVAIRASYNVSSITDNGTGDYTVNFTTALADANYSVVCSCREDTISVSYTTNRLVAPRRASTTVATSSVRLGAAAFDNTATDVESVYVSIFR